MAGKSTHRQKEDNDLVDVLLRLPKRNLESRIRELKSEIKKREKLRDESLSRLFTSRAKIANLENRTSYAGTISEALRRQIEVLGSRTAIEQDIAQEESGAFRDLSKLRSELQQAREELATERQKLALVSGGKVARLESEKNYASIRSDYSTMNNDRHRRSTPKA